MNPHSRSGVLKALKYYAVYLGKPDLFDQMRKKAGLKWKAGQAPDAALKILLRDSVGEGFAYLRKVARSDLDDRYKQVVYLAAETGIRAKEVFMLKRLHERIPVRDGFYECFRLPQFLRRSKNLFMVYHDEIVEKRLKGLPLK